MQSALLTANLSETPALKEKSTYHAQGIYRLGSDVREGSELLLRQHGGYSLNDILDKPELFTKLLPGLFEAKIHCFPFIQDKHGQRVFINLTPGQLKNPQLPKYIDKLIMAANQRLKLVIEVTENELIDDWSNVIGTLRGIQRKGVEIAVDDFGTGYANLKSLICIRPAFVKIDRSIIDKACECQASENFIYSLVGFIHNLGMKAIIEGIETQEHLAIAMKSRAELGQGYLFEHPGAIC